MSSSVRRPACGVWRCRGGGVGSDGGSAGARSPQRWSRPQRGSLMAGVGGLAASGAHSRARCAPPRASGPLQPPERGHPPPPAARADRVAEPRARQPRRADVTGRTVDNIGGGFPPDRRSATHILDRPLGGRPPITLNPRWLCSQTNRLTRNEPRLGEARRPHPHITDGCHALPIDRRKRPRAAQSRRYSPTPTPTARSERVSLARARRASSALRAVRARGSPPPASRAPSPRRPGPGPGVSYRRSVQAWRRGGEGVQKGWRTVG
jgi:hypothetical protein